MPIHAIQSIDTATGRFVYPLLRPSDRHDRGTDIGRKPRRKSYKNRNPAFVSSQKNSTAFQNLTGQSFFKLDLHYFSAARGDALMESAGRLRVKDLIQRN
jgi:hypothetical protein